MTFMSGLFPPPPSTGSSLSPHRASRQARDLLALRRSSGKRALCAPGPGPEEIDRLLQVAARVPDHRRLAPWRFLVFEGAARSRFNAKAVEILRAEDPEATETMLKDTSGYLTRAPVAIAVISSPDHAHRTPVWEQELSCGAVCLNLLLAAQASGWAGCWLTEWIAYSPGIGQMLGLSQHERLAGFIYLGTASALPQERMRPDMQKKISRWTHDAKAEDQRG